MKGADVVMTAIVQYNDWLEEEVGVSEIIRMRKTLESNYKYNFTN